jgi:hypothetical protein
MSAWTSPLVIGFFFVAMLGYGALFIPSLGGWGYAGYGGFHRGPSLLYWGGARTHHDPSVRAGSHGGPGLHGGGMHGGK